MLCSSVYKGQCGLLLRLPPLLEQSLLILGPRPWSLPFLPVCSPLGSGPHLQHSLIHQSAAL